MVDETGNQRTDLVGTTVHVPDDPASWPVRVPVVSEVHADGMSIVRTTWVSRREPRVDLDIALTLPNIAPRSLHAGIVTIDPRSLGGEDVRFATVNGGTAAAEHRSVPNRCGSPPARRTGCRSAPASAPRRGGQGCSAGKAASRCTSTGH